MKMGIPMGHTVGIMAAQHNKLGVVEVASDIRQGV